MPKRVLVADDSVTIQRAFAMVFGGQDVTLVAARSVDDAVAQAKRERPDLVIADASMGAATGYDLCSALRADPALQAVPVLILASSHVPYDEVRGQRVGANGHFTKPFDSQALLDLVANTLKGAVAAPRPVTPAPAPVVQTPAAVAPSRPSIPVPALDYDLTLDRPSDRATAAVPPLDRASRAVPPLDKTSRPVAPLERPSSPVAPLTRPVTAPPPARPAAAPASTPNLRPSLIPGVRPGSVPPVRPATVTATAPNPASNRTMMGMPAINMPMPTPSAPSRGGAAPGTVPARSPSIPVTPLASNPATAAAVSSVAQKVADLASRGPEYEAIAKLSREVIEQIVWEVVPELAEVIIRQEIDRLAAAKR